MAGKASKKFRKLNLLQDCCYDSGDERRSYLKPPPAMSTMKLVMPRTVVQRVYYETLRHKHVGVVVATGAAGTGKTLLACASAADAFDRGLVHRIVLTRPAVSSEEAIGYLPGTMECKMQPYTRVMTDIFEDIWGASRVRMFQENNSLEIAPLGFMRGRTFHNTWVILDESQNTTPAQMKMALTRLGEGSKMVVTGDTAQSDIEGENGLQDLIRRIPEDHPTIRHIQLGEADILRSQIVKDVLALYI